MPFVDGIGIFRDDHRANAVERRVAEPALFHRVPDNELALAFIGKAPELTVAAVLTIARFDAVSLQPVWGGLHAAGRCSHDASPTSQRDVSIFHLEADNVRCEQVHYQPGVYGTRVCRVKC